MLCKDCLYFKQWKPLNTAMCEKTLQSVESNERPCDEFVARKHMVNEWGEKCDGNRNSCN